MRTTYPERPATIRIRRGALDFVVLFALVLLVALLAVIFGWQYWHADRIYSGVTVSNVPVGGLTRAQALERLNRTLVRQPLPPMLVTFGGRQWPIGAGQATASIDTLDAVNKAYMVGRRGDASTKLDEQISAALGAITVRPALNLDVPQLRQALSQVASEVRTPARAGVLVNDLYIEPQPGVDVDVDSTLANLVQVLQNHMDDEQVVAPLLTIALDPPPEVESPQATSEQTLASLSSAPLMLRDTRYGLEFAIDPAALEGLTFSHQPLRLDEDRLRTLVEGWAGQIDIAPVDARLRFDQAAGAPAVVQNSRVGRELDVDGTMASIRDAVSNGSMAASLIIRDRLPAVDSRYISQMGIQELVASGTTYFAGSSPARVHNIEVAAEKFEGVVIPPNGIFSFNKVVEDVTGANGFEDSLIIWGDRTAVGVGGGVCQVSTTVFRAAYAAGLPIVERYNHGYVVSWYGEPGLDATIYTPSVDFRFRNDTGSYLLLEPVVDGIGGTITFNLYGTKPDRVVTIGEPVITDIVEPEPAIYRYDETLGYGEKEQVDWEQNGMTSKVTRTILENGETRSETLTSVYQPWRAVYLYGPGVDVPATPTASPRSDATGNGEGGIALPTPTSQPNASEAESVSAEASPGDSASSESTSTP